MARRAPSDHDDDPRPEDVEAFSDATTTCPKCGIRLYDDVAICWKCGHAMQASSVDGGARPPLWIVLTAGLLVLAFLLPVVLKMI